MQKIKEYLNENKILFFIVLCTCLVLIAIYSRLIYIYYKSSDYTIYLTKWWSAIEENGIKEALKLNIGNYTEFYKIILIIGACITKNSLLYIKISTFIFEMLFAFSIYLFAKNIFNKSMQKSILIALGSLLIPTVVINGSIVAQCDIIYTTMICFMIYFILRDKYKISLLFFGFAFAIKLQAIFIAPIILYLLIHKKIKIREVMLIPIPYIFFSIPSMIAGKNIKDVLFTYIDQTQDYSHWVRNAPNLYQLRDLNLERINTLETVIPVVMVAIMLVVVILLFRKHYSRDIVITLAMFFTIIIPYLLPKMHERYFFLADILSFIYIIAFGKSKIPIHICVVFASFVSYGSYLLYGLYVSAFGEKFLLTFGLDSLAWINLIAVFLVIVDLIFEHVKARKKIILV